MAEQRLGVRLGRMDQPAGTDVRGHRARLMLHPRPLVAQYRIDVGVPDDDTASAAVERGPQHCSVVAQSPVSRVAIAEKPRVEDHV
ncbi:hypothetical protein JK364_00205 [Streptomyces sp. 110]|uniref:Uncharacterized protein n=1 Tax=Streptomyces endocoffeicus TaxID=2898945 RepID=A0ABS1PFD0_9ACTN|nr:hypothetical protein [Streptomyces endocoffeicus]MBL1110844.1 hypothetical protein [Streptomyces endocoffeicus]